MINALLKDAKFLLNAIEAMRDGLMIVDPDGNVIFFNKAAETMTGYTREEILGKQCTVLDSDTCVVLTESGRQKHCEIFALGTIENKKCRIRSKDGRAVYLLKNAVVMKDHDGKTLGVVESMTDITSLYMKELEIEELKQELKQEYWFMGLLGRSRPMQELYEQIRNAAGSEAPVLIVGESGTGKNLIANAIHRLSRRKGGPFVAMNCASLNEQLMESELFGHKKGAFTGAISDRIGRFEAAHTGSIFLDEIGDMPVTMQAKLLRVLEDKLVERVGDHRPIQVDIRLISATNKDIPALVKENKFREDLLYRVNTIQIQAPPLRERAEDIPVIAFHYLKKISIVNNKDVRSISNEAMEIIENFPWPGNVRQLINALEHSAITCKGDAIEVSDLPDYLFHTKKPEATDHRADREAIRSALAAFKGNRSLTAKHLGISRVTLWKKMKEMNLD